MGAPPQGQRAGWAPATDGDFGDGGAFPEVDVEQFPGGMGRIEALVPMTFMSGFLGSGKTTTLKHILQNQEGKRVGVVVNDVAEVNIDAKLIRQRTAEMAQQDQGIDMTDTVELDNGCACCTAGGDLMDSILKLIRLSIRRGYHYDRVVVEMSGVSEPKNLRAEFLDCADSHYVFKYVELQTMVTVVDSSHFLKLYSSKLTIKEMPNLVVKEGEAMGPKPVEGEEPHGEHAEMSRRVVDLLVEMMECADLVLLNKSDRLSEGERASIIEIAKQLNPTATVLAVEFGKAPLEHLLGAPKGKWACKADEDDDLRMMVQAVRKGKKTHSRRQQAEEPAQSGGDGAMFGAMALPSAVAKGHKRNHTDVEGPTDQIGTKRALPARQQTSVAQRFGIFSFVYSRRRPFNPGKLMEVLKLLPVKVDDGGKVTDKWGIEHVLLSEEGAPETAAGGCGGSGEGSAAAAGGDGKQGTSAQGNGEKIMHNILRSKGFTWLANMPSSVMYWSHAGHFFSLDGMGEWWAATPLEDWPSNVRDVNEALQDFERPEPYQEGVAKQRLAGDRRQEIVFIGIDLDQDAIEGLLDACLLSDQEYERYNQVAKPDTVMLKWPTDPEGTPLVRPAPGGP